MRVEQLRAYRMVLSEFGPGRAARLMRMTPMEEREATRILSIHENDSYWDGDETVRLERMFEDFGGELDDG